MNFSESFKYFVDAVGTNVTSYLKVTDQTHGQSKYISGNHLDPLLCEGYQNINILCNDFKPLINRMAKIMQKIYSKTYQSRPDQVLSTTNKN